MKMCRLEFQIKNETTHVTSDGEREGWEEVMKGVDEGRETSTGFDEKGGT